MNTKSNRKNAHFSGCVIVKPGIKKDGSMNKAYIRTKPDGIKENNFSFKWK